MLDKVLLVIGFMVTVPRNKSRDKDMDFINTKERILTLVLKCFLETTSMYDRVLLQNLGTQFDKKIRLNSFDILIITEYLLKYVYIF